MKKKLYNKFKKKLCIFFVIIKITVKLFILGKKIFLFTLRINFNYNLTFCIKISNIFSYSSILILVLYKNNQYYTIL